MARKNKSEGVVAAMQSKWLAIAFLCIYLAACSTFQPQSRIKHDKIIFLGNSITLHPPAPTIGWYGNYGMAASAEQNDYVHLVSKKVGAEFMAFNLADWERGYSNYNYGELKKHEGWADVVIIKLGENVTEMKSDFKSSLERLSKLLNCHNTILVSTWWANPPLNESMRSIALENNFKWVQLPKHDETYNAVTFENSGVATHPGDKGMQLIADSILSVLKN